MRAVVKKINCKRSDIFKIILLGDFHIGNVGSEEEKIKGHIDWIRRTPNVFWIDMGDKCEFITPTDKRWDSGSVASWIKVSEINDLPNVQADRYCKLVAPIKHKCLGLLQGNHEYMIYKSYYNDIHTNICCRLGVPNLGFLSIVRLFFSRSNGSDVSVDILVTHGAGGGRYIGGKINKLISLSKDFDADIYAMGHMHDKISYKQKKIYLNRRNRIAEKTRLLCAVPSFFTTYNENATSYGERALYSPTATGVTKIAIQPFKNMKSDLVDSTYCDIHISE